MRIAQRFRCVAKKCCESRGGFADGGPQTGCSFAAAGGHSRIAGGDRTQIAGGTNQAGLM